MATYLLSIDTDFRQSEIPFTSESDATAIGDLFIHVQRCHLEQVSRAALYRLSIGTLNRESGLFTTVVGECVYDSDVDGDDGLDAEHVVGHCEHIVLDAVS